jgi:2-iminobutanoate/2-iminopropanoate deaminase
MGLYSQAVRAGGLLFVSGQIPLDPVTGELVRGDAAAQAEQVMTNLRAVLEAGGCGFGDVVRATVYLVDLAQFGAVNAVYERFVPAPYPARATLQVAALPRGAQVEIEVTALVPPARISAGGHAGGRH